MPAPTTRATLLETTQARLVAASTAAGSRVRIGRTGVVQAAELPMITLSISRETSTHQAPSRDARGRSVLARTSTLEIGCYVGDPGGSADPTAVDAAVDAALTALVEAVRAVVLGEVGTGSLAELVTIVGETAAYYSAIEGAADVLGAAVLSVDLLDDRIEYGV